SSLVLPVIALLLPFSSFLFFYAPPPPDIYTLSLHDALPISRCSLIPGKTRGHRPRLQFSRRPESTLSPPRTYPFWIYHFTARSIDRKSTRLNSSHRTISYAVFCLKKKKKKKTK